MKYIKNNTGMITIEACFIIPLTIMITLVIVWIGFLFYNRCVLTEAANITVMEAAYQAEKSNEELMETMTKRFEELVRDQIVCIEDLHVEAEVSYSELKLSITGQMEVPGEILITEGYEARPWDITVEKSAPRLRKSMIIRTVERSKDFLLQHEQEEETE